MDQIKLHKRIDEFLARDPRATNPEAVSALFSEAEGEKAREDARHYFFTQADERWLDWLRKNGFLEAIKEKAEDPTKYGYRMPELNYLVKVAEKEPKKVAKIILDTSISKENFNPEVIAQFLRICTVLPVDQLAQIIQKIEKDGWVQLMSSFNSWGFEYQKMLEKLVEAQDYESLIILSRVILKVRPRDEVKSEGFAGVSREKPFYFSDLSYANVFERLATVDDEHVEQVLELATSVLSQVVNLGDKTDEDEVFKVQEIFHLFDVDFFDLKLGEKRHFSYRDDVRELAALVKTFAERTIGSADIRKNQARKLYQTYFEDLPDSRAMWRLRLYVLSLKPKYFEPEIETALFRLFKVMDEGKSYANIVMGAEYENILKHCFDILPQEKRQEYIANVISYFKREYDRGKEKGQVWHLEYGERILSVIDKYSKKHLTDKEKLLVKENGFEIKKEYEPSPTIRETYAGAITPRGPISQEKFSALPIKEIAQKLRNEWSPKSLQERFKGKDFHRPRNAEGAGGLLQKDMEERFQEYISNAHLFFEKDVLDPHYTYTFLQGVREVIKKDRKRASEIEWKDLIEMLKSIKDAELDSERKKRDADAFDMWLANWTAVHMAMDDVIQELLEGEDDVMVIDFKIFRDDLLMIIEHLLSYPNPMPEDEKPKTAESRDDPFTKAINTVRGRAFQIFVLFVYRDGKNSEGKIKQDVKDIYEKVLSNERTRAIMFMFGHYIPSFYFRDIEWIHSLLPRIFSSEPEKTHLYRAAWEGYLSNNLFREIFGDRKFRELYERGILNSKESDSPRKHFKDPDEGLAVHLALAFMHFPEFDFEDELFKIFWEKGSIEQKANFASFIGRTFISSQNPRADELLKKDTRAKEQIKKLWDYLLKEHSDHPKIFTQMGFWINLERDIFEPKWLATHVRDILRETQGKLEWDYGLTKAIGKLAKEAPEETLEIVRLHLLEDGLRGSERRVPLSIDNEWYEAFQILYSKKPDETYKLIDDLIREGGSSFWKLKDIL